MNENIVYLEKQLKACANKRRLLILRYLKNKKLIVGDIAREIKLSIKATSRHLGKLYGVRILDKNQISSNVFYEINSAADPIIKLILSRL